MEEHGHPHLLHFLYKFHILPKWIPEEIPFSWLIILILASVVFLTTRRLNKVPTRWQGLLELIVTGLDSFTKSVIGEKGSPFTPLIGSFFIYILVMNLFGLVPGMLSPTTNFNTTIALALVTFMVVQFSSMKERGIIGYLKEFLEMVPPGKIGIFMSPLLVPVSIIVHGMGEIAKPFSLFLRLRSAIFSDETALLTVIILLPVVLKYILPLPIYIMMLFLAPVVGLIHAFIFSILSATYIKISIETHGE